MASSITTASTIIAPILVFKPSLAANNDNLNGITSDSNSLSVPEGSSSANVSPVNGSELLLLECSLHTLPKSLRREFEHVFRGHYKNYQGCTVNRSNTSDDTTNNKVKDEEELLEVLAIPTNQRARKDLVSFGDEVEAEKDRLLNVFIDFAKEICNLIQSRGYWADYIDPCSGLPMLTPNCNKVYSEVFGMEVLLGYRSQNAGCCKVLLHPQWGSAVYPATIFCYAPRDLIRDIIERLPTATDCSTTTKA